MAETAVSILIEQLAPLIRSEVQLLSGVRDEVVEIKETLKTIRASLKDAERRQQTEEGVKVWVDQVREVAYDIENVLDEFLYRMGQPRGEGFTGILRRCTRFFRHLSARHKIASDIQGIKGRLSNISDRRSQFSFASTTGEDESLKSKSSLNDPRLTAPLFLEESEVVGIEKTREDLIKLLLVEDPKPIVVSVIGMGGQGKTTLVRRVYENAQVRKIFNSFAWITVSSFSPEELLKSMLKELMKTTEVLFSDDINNMNYVQLVQAAKNILQEKRYVVVFDDVWTINAWEHLKCALPENELKSRIMVTTRIQDVASYCSKSLQYVYKLGALPPKEAWTLFCLKVFNGICPSELVKPSEKILEMCGGLPLAIVAVGGLLLTKNKTPTEWDKVQRNLSLELENNDLFANMKKILWLSYDGLPYHLKPCLLYFSIFPQDYIIRRGHLIREWIAEGFVMPMHGMTLEQIAEGYLNELVHRSLIEVARFNSYGRVSACRVHDLMHDLILSKSREQNFITLGRDGSDLHDRAHRLSIYSGDCNQESRRFSEVRSLFIFSGGYIPDFSRFKMLKVLNLSGMHLGIFPNGIVSLFHLRYLNLRRTGIKEIPKSIGKLKNLETLDLKFTYVSELPAGILHCRRIRLIRKYRLYYEGSATMEEGVKMPAKLGRLTLLHKLDTLQLDGGKEQAQELGKLTQLRTLGISTGRGQDWITLQESISSLRNLETLWISTNVKDEPLDINFLVQLSPSLRIVGVRGCLQKLPDITGSFVNLIKINLISSRLHDDPLKALQHLQNLTDLLLEDAYDGEEMCSGPRSFQCLKSLSIVVNGSLKHINVEKGGMPKLEYLIINDCPMLQKVPDGIENLTTLKELVLQNMPANFIQRIRGEDKEMVRHIPFIEHSQVGEHKWYREVLQALHKD